MYLSRVVESSQIDYPSIKVISDYGVFELEFFSIIMAKGSITK
jgi:hypothetical protein